MKKIKTFIKTYIPTPSLIIFMLALLCGVILIISEFSAAFSDIFNRYVGTAYRGTLAGISALLPFSLAETLIISLPMIAVLLFASVLRASANSGVRAVRCVTALVSVLALMGSMFVVSTAVAYNGTSLADKLGLEAKPVSTEELRDAALYMIDKMNEELDLISFSYGGSSDMPMSLSEMNQDLLAAYKKASEKYPFIPSFYSKIKPVALSELMTYTHISGMYTYYTGEANLNINFPDYNLPYTAAHEFAHQRGIMPENEANFTAFLVCIESDSPYIRYSGYLNMYEYLNSALYSADYEVFSEVYLSLDVRVQNEISAYNRFFEKYRDNTAADISSALNDTYLKSQGQTEGEKSYGMVVDLAVAYVKSLNDR